ncbi:hypothetical protein ACJ73_09301 [Blastomyces percursus]|uniref:Uncharacterized protein n=1 Tax=Blastomyces percursus TaxID=1658174 RepID=A0A1J9PXZ8_9EURO|nr:hypothetical protein ACJ73_09301 [Blastomyces percursus]
MPDQGSAATIQDIREGAIPSDSQQVHRVDGAEGPANSIVTTTANEQFQNAHPGLYQRRLRMEG